MKVKPGTPLNKTKTVLHRDKSWPNGPSRPTYFPLQGSNKSSQVILDHDVYEDMGCPDTITMTIRPGNHLN